MLRYVGNAMNLECNVKYHVEVPYFCRSDWIVKMFFRKGLRQEIDGAFVSCSLTMDTGLPKDSCHDIMYSRPAQVANRISIKLHVYITIT